MDKSIDWTRPVEDQHGTPYRVLLTNRPGGLYEKYPVLLMNEVTGELSCSSYEGRAGTSFFRNRPVVTSKFHNIWQNNELYHKQYTSIDAARAGRDPSSTCLGVVEVVLADGVATDVKLHPADA